MRLHLTKVAAPLTAACLLAVGGLGSGCRYDEGLIIENLHGRVIIPAEAAGRDHTIFDEDGTSRTKEIRNDIRMIGPVYLGLYPSVHPPGAIEPYSHPEVGPQFIEDVPGDTYPYGGTTVGDLRFACFEFLSCKITSGRFESFEDIVDWFGNVVEQPVTDAAGAEVENGDFIRQTCYEILEVTSDDEVRITQTRDTDNDGTIDASDLDFVLDEQTNEYVAEFTIWQQQWFWDVNQEKEEDCTPGVDCTGPTLWGFMDSPSTSDFSFGSCNGTLGFRQTEYNADFRGGAAEPTILNQPAEFIERGDWVAEEGFVWNNIYQEAEIRLNFEVQ